MPLSIRRFGLQAMSRAATASMTAAVAQWTPNAIAFGPPLRRTIVPSAVGISAMASSSEPSNRVLR